MDSWRRISGGLLTFFFWRVCVDHVEVVIRNYFDELIDDSEFQRSHQPFIGSVCRMKVDFESDPFQTFDTVMVCNNQRMSPEMPMPCIRTVYLLSSWDADGVPISFFRIPPECVTSWISRTEGQPCSYVYCLPDWFQHSGGPATKFVYSTSSRYQEVTYANLPWDKTPFHQCIRSPSVYDIEFSSSSMFSLQPNKFSP